jgi:hypothetical protein
MDELFDSGIGLAYQSGYNFFFDEGEETEASKVKQNSVICPSDEICVNWAIYQKNVSVLLEDMFAEQMYMSGALVGDNSEPLLCNLEDGVVSNTGLSMIMFYGDPLLRRINEIIEGVVEAGIYNYWISLNLEALKIFNRKIAIVQPLDGYYSFILYHVQPAFYLLLMGWCLSALYLIVELLYNRVLSKLM